MIIDAGREIDWGRTSDDYARHRPGPPDSFYEKLRALEVGVPGQRMLDLGTGTGVLARSFARRGCHAAGVDVSPGQIAAAQRLAREEGLEVDFRVAPAEATSFGDGVFDVVTANQCWLYFDMSRAIPEVRRLLAPGGLLMVSHFSWLPREDPIARASEELVSKWNPDWSGADWDGHVPARPGWSHDAFELRAMFFYDEPIAFTRESWRGRMRALRGIGASLTDEQVRAFDREHEALLGRTAAERFTVLHRLDAHVFAFREAVPDTP
ncbi:MAG: methyltransferase domain-containing protein [Myxococcota bacterium]|nr:methyltransferase domain-containing protein [Myxococcota bacterium]